MKNNKNFLMIALAVIVLGVLGAVVVQNNRPTETAIPAQTTSDETVAENDAGDVMDLSTGMQETVAAAMPSNVEAGESVINYDSASLPDSPLGVRTLGDPDAPIRIEEFASLTCGHCASFHNTTFRELKRKYIDTGKVFFTFTDFPLNAPALDATMVARCMPPERYFTFLSFLFQTQEQWAFTQDYRNSLRQNAKLAGMSDERFDSCMADEELKEGLITRMQQKAETHALNSTPSFVINGSTVITGAVGIEAFDMAIANIEAQNTPAATEVEAEPEADVEVEAEESVEESSPEAEEAAEEVTEETEVTTEQE